ncbi:MAG: hypothetical protein PHQ74_05165 [Crocinitomicaceae bacterium]|nr:hypothetical protein [Crocinitomicaceae bacterium]
MLIFTDIPIIDTSTIPVTTTEYIDSNKGVSLANDIYLVTKINFSTRAKNSMVKLVKDTSKSDKLALSFSSQLERYSNYIKSTEDLRILFKNVIDDVISFGFPRMKVSISQHESFTFYLSGKDNANLSFEVFSEDNKPFIVYSIYNNDELAEMNSGDLFTTRHLIKTFLNQGINSTTRDFSDITEDTRFLEIQY